MRDAENRETPLFTTCALLPLEVLGVDPLDRLLRVAVHEPADDRAAQVRRGRRDGPPGRQRHGELEPKLLMNSSSSPKFDELMNLFIKN